jgi:hypothetical protein
LASTLIRFSSMADDRCSLLINKNNALHRGIHHPS